MPASIRADEIVKVAGVSTRSEDPNDHAHTEAARRADAGNPT